MILVDIRHFVPSYFLCFQDSAIKTLEISLAQKTEELVEFEQRLRKLQEEKILLLREKQELSKQVEALEEQVRIT